MPKNKVLLSVLVLALVQSSASATGFIQMKGKKTYIKDLPAAKSAKPKPREEDPKEAIELRTEHSPNEAANESSTLGNHFPPKAPSDSSDRAPQSIGGSWKDSILEKLKQFKEAQKEKELLMKEIEKEVN